MKKTGAVIAIGIIVLSIVYGIIVSATAGSDSDPLITKSYIDTVVMPELNNYMNNLFEDKVFEAEKAPTFTVVSVSKGSKLIADGGTELILRMGKGTIISTDKGGIVDSSDGVDLPNGANMPSNHLLIVPLNDGRGFTALEDVLVMVKGKYEIR